ncbi:MAG: hypothetical protein C0458_10575 [Methylobacterium sp.]|nr:hypothetical protein [Methylobacterium sp.]
MDFIVDDLNERLRLAPGDSGTILWKDFYADYGIQRFKAPRPDQIKEQARAKFGLIVSFGDNVVNVAYDRNFNPI